MSIKIRVYSWFTVTSNECNVSPYRIGEFSSVPRTRIQTIELNNEARVYSARDSAWIKDIHFKDRCKADPLNSSDKCEQRDLFRIARRRSFSKLYFPFVIYLLLGPLSWAKQRATLWATLAHHPQSLPRPGFQSWARRHRGNIFCARALRFPRSS